MALGLSGYFARFWHASEKLLLIGSVAAFAYLLLVQRQFEWRMGEVPIAFVICLALAFASFTMHAWRKRRNAGIYRFRTGHVPQHTADLLAHVESDYLYVGQSFKSMLEVFKQSNERGGMARSAKLRLLLADPENCRQLEFLASVHYPAMTAEEKRRDLAGRILETIELVKGRGPIEIRKHVEPLRGWLHKFDESTLVFGMLPRGKPGDKAPAMDIEPMKNHWALFEHFSDWAEHLWNTSTEVPDLDEWARRLRALSEEPPRAASTSS